MICLFLIPWNWCCNSKSHVLGRIGKGFSLNQLSPLKVLGVLSCYVVIFVCVLLVCCRAGGSLVGLLRISQVKNFHFGIQIGIDVIDILTKGCNYLLPSHKMLVISSINSKNILENQATVQIQICKTVSSSYDCSCRCGYSS